VTTVNGRDGVIGGAGVARGLLMLLPILLGLTLLVPVVVAIVWLVRYRLSRGLLKS
jgi:hypothetical protein